MGVHSQGTVPLRPVQRASKRVVTKGMVVLWSMLAFLIFVIVFAGTVGANTVTPVSASTACTIGGK